MYNYRAWILLAAVCCVSGEIFVSDSSRAENKVLEEANTRQFFPFIPLNIPLPNRPATAPTPVIAPTPVAAPVAAPVAVTPAVTPAVAATLPNCPAKCCLRYCKDGIFCTPAVAPALPMCSTGGATGTGRCNNPQITGCAATVCKIQATCQTNCGNVMDVINPAFCN